MGNFIRQGKNTLLEVIGNIDVNKFNIPITEELLVKNGWELFDGDEGVPQWYPVKMKVQIDGKFQEIDLDDYEDEYEDFLCLCVWYKETKDAWCYRYSFGSYVFDIKSIAELEIILAREGFVYEFEI